jgi:site-specific DNA-methyltransferase (cytosine-N4-specific)
VPKVNDNVLVSALSAVSTIAPEEGLCRVIEGDARHVEQFLSKGAVKCVVTSPPYWGLRSYGAENEIGSESTIDQYLENISKVFSAIWNVLSDDGTVWIIIGDAYTSGNRRYRHPDKKHISRAMVTRPKTPVGLKRKDLIGLPWKVAFRLQADGWFLRSDIIWHKSNPIPESVKDRPHQSHEHIFLLSKSERYKFDWNALRQCESEKAKFSRNVWTVAVNAGSTGHAAPFPLDLVRPCIMASTSIGELVLDPFAGSGSVGLACQEMGRAFVGVELLKENVRLARDRLTLTVEHNSCGKPESSKPRARTLSSKDLQAARNEGSDVVVTIAY